MNVLQAELEPEVTIYKAAGGYKMKVEGMDDTIYVRRIK
jgi:hypothetical protein